MSVVIAAHNEGRVIRRCLDALSCVPDALPAEVVVAANGCTDDTVSVARRAGVRVLDLPEAGKGAALNAAEQTMTAFPRAYLDADIELASQDLVLLMDAVLPRGVALAAAPRRVVDLTGSPLLVRAYYAVSRLHPAFSSGIFGRGLIVLSEEGRRRFDLFPNMIADDLFLDSLFESEEKTEVQGVLSRVAAPRRTGDLIRRLARVRRGNSELRKAALPGALVRPQEGIQWLVKAVIRRPTLAPAAIVYVSITLTASVRSRRETVAWGQDLSSRSVVTDGR